ncbi:FUSC family protein [Winogradskyella maritima]|uniref:FUSC family protein n=1 Tax=Winogradskyella maritima TaxID=1517766 RepID=A0ABV8ACP1_9FLAO|nr:FUSC family protein [Winogradskyella maritima]
MKRLLIILGFISAIFAVILAVTPLNKLAVFPVILAFLCGLGLLWLSKKKGFKSKSIQYIFLLSIIAISVTIYKGVFTETVVGDVEELEQRDEESVEDSKDLLEDLDIEDIEIDDSDF